MCDHVAIEESDARDLRVAPVRRVLVLNAGSSSFKWSLLDAGSERTVEEGEESWQPGSAGGPRGAIATLLARLPDLDAVGHRVVHGGPDFRQAVVITPTVRDAIEAISELAPLHNPRALAGIDAVTATRPDLPQVAAFDTAFHHTLPPAAATYAVPRDWTIRYGLRRYGFHGLSVAYAVRRTHELLGRLPARLVVCHLGNGSSVSAVADGRSVDTSMGFTPLEGVVMGTRSGSIDPGLVLFLLTKRGMSVADLDHALNSASGLLGVSGISSDLRQILASMASGNPEARLAYDVLVHSLVRTIGAMAAVLGGLEALVFTGGIGEHSPDVRLDVAASLGYLGLRLDAAANTARQDDTDIATPGARVRVLVLEAREDLTVLAEVKRLLS